MAKAELVINLSVGSPRLGIWCDDCLTSARYEVEVVHLTADGPRPFKVIRRCTRCDDDG